MVPHPPSSPSSSAAAGSTSGLTAAPPGTLLAPAPALRRLLLSLSKPALIDLVLQWLSSTSSYVTRPTLSTRATSSNSSSTRIFLYLHEQRRASSLAELRELWSRAMREASVPKTRAVDRTLEVDWPNGLTYEMVAMLACQAVRAGGTTKTWTTARLDFQGGQVPDSYRNMSPTALRTAFSAELAHYFTHHLHLDVGSGSSSDMFSAFTHLRLVLPPLPSDMCAGTHLLLLPATPFVLLSGSLARAGGAQSRAMLLAALAHALGATGASVASSSAASQEEEGMGELKGKDPTALRNILLGANNSSGLTKGAGGGAVRRMREAKAEQDPLVQPHKRTRTFAQVQDEHEDELELDEPGEQTVHPATRAKRKRVQGEATRARQREVEEVFGSAEGEKNADLDKIDRIDYELHLATPKGAPYHVAQCHETEPVRLRLQGTHVLAGLRQLVAKGATDTTSNQALQQHESAGGREGRFTGLPAWLTQPSGTRIVVRPVVHKSQDDETR